MTPTCLRLAIEHARRTDPSGALAVLDRLCRSVIDARDELDFAYSVDEEHDAEERLDAACEQLRDAVGMRPDVASIERKHARIIRMIANLPIRQRRPSCVLRAWRWLTRRTP